jgi:hypothetical protein
MALQREWKIVGISEITAKPKKSTLPSPLAGAFFMPKNPQREVGRGGAALGEKWRMVVEKGGKWSKVGD